MKLFYLWILRIFQGISGENYPIQGSKNLGDEHGCPVGCSKLGGYDGFMEKGTSFLFRPLVKLVKKAMLYPQNVYLQYQQMIDEYKNH